MKKRYSKIEAIGIIIAAATLLVCGAYSLYNKDYISVALLSSAAVFVIATGYDLNRRHKKSLTEYVEMITAQKEGMSGDAISKFPIPMAVLKINGQISWYNNMFSEMLGSNDLYNIVISDVMPELKWSEILKSQNGIYTYAGYKGHKYNVVGDIIKNINSKSEKPDFSVLLYFIDKTEIESLRKRYEEEKIDVGIISIDNYEEVFQQLDDSDLQEAIAQINKYVNTWVAESHGVIKKVERDRYIVIFEHKYLKEYIAKKFDILEKARAIGAELNIPISLSIGIGSGGSISENDAYSRAALDMAHGRGGDQAAVKDSSQYNFYGGIAKDYEKSTRVKTRAFAVAFKDFIQNSDKVIFMGHASHDYDSFGSALGLQRAVRSLEKDAYIVLDNSPAISLLEEEVMGVEEYEGMFITPDEAGEMITMNTLLVVLDTHRPSMLPSPQLLEKTTKVVLIDHHRRSTEFLSNISLVYHEPYASSTAEMATEIMQYIDTEKKMTSLEAKALYVGLLMDTKNFTIKTGVRTFESASYLRRYGLNTTEVRRLFAVGKNDYSNRAEIVRQANEVCENILVSVCDEAYPNMRVISSQAADEMLSLSGISAAFVIYPAENEVCISARSIGDINVQIIAEKLGGGGHATVAGAQIKGISTKEAYESLKNAILETLEENGKD